MLNLVIDSGNTRIKAAEFNDSRLEKKHSFSTEAELKSYLDHQSFAYAIVSSVSVDGHRLLNEIHAQKKFLLTHHLPLPVNIHYQTPHTLGVDRIAAVCGA